MRRPMRIVCSALSAVKGRISNAQANLAPRAPTETAIDDRTGLAYLVVADPTPHLQNLQLKRGRRELPRSPRR